VGHGYSHQSDAFAWEVPQWKSKPSDDDDDGSNVGASLVIATVSAIIGLFEGLLEGGLVVPPAAHDVTA
jgi:hypothetical protein